MSVVAFNAVEDGKGYIDMPAATAKTTTTRKKKLLLAAVFGTVAVAAVSVGVIYGTAAEEVPVFDAFQSNIEWLTSDVGNMTNVEAARDFEFAWSKLPRGGKCSRVGKGKCDRRKEYRTLCSGGGRDDECKRDSECKRDEECKRGKCRKERDDDDNDECKRDNECKKNEECRRGQCRYKRDDEDDDQCKRDSECKKNKECRRGKCKDKGSDDDEECRRDSECKKNEECSRGKCKKAKDDDECRRDSECKKQEKCRRGKCRKDNDDDDDDECKRDSDCGKKQECSRGKCKRDKDNDDDSECKRDRECGKNKECSRGKCKKSKDNDDDDDDDDDKGKGGKGGKSGKRSSDDRNKGNCSWDRYRCEQACRKDKNCGGFESGVNGSCRIFDSRPSRRGVKDDNKYECYECKDSFGGGDNNDDFEPRCEELNDGKCSSNDNYSKKYNDISYDKCERKCRADKKNCSGYQYDSKKKECLHFDDFPGIFHDDDDSRRQRGYNCHACDTWQQSDNGFNPKCSLVGKGKCDADNYRYEDGQISYAACEYRCTVNPRCEAYEWDKFEDNKNCKLIFESVDGYNRNSRYKNRVCHNCLGDNDTFKPTCGLVGKGKCDSDNFSYQNGEVSYSECEYKCKQDRNCNAYEWTNDSKPDCKLIFENVDTYNDRYTDRVCHQCVGNYDFEPQCELVGKGKCDSRGGEYEDDENISYKDCESRCGKNQDCKAYEWNKKEGWCKLFFEEVDEFDDKYSDRICHNCEEKPVDDDFTPECKRLGKGRCDASNYEYESGRISSQQCEARCGDKSGCKAYEWNTKDKRCKLISERVDDYSSKYSDRRCYSCDNK